MKIPVKNLPVAIPIHAKVKATAAKAGIPQYIHAGGLIIDGFRYRARRHKELSKL